MAKANITVTVEAAIHNGLNEFAQHVFDKYGIQIRTVEIDWSSDRIIELEVSTKMKLQANFGR